MDRAELKAKIMSVTTSNFEEVALAVFGYQYKSNSTYRQWVDCMNIDPNQVKALNDIPHLPISAFKMYKIHCDLEEEEAIFESSGTTGSTPSRHYVYDMQLYLDTAQNIFEKFYGPVANYCYLALLPSYLERQGSSLVAMVDHFISQSPYSQSGFYLYDHERLRTKLLECKQLQIPTILFGVSFALLDFIEASSISYPGLIVIETGGMKGRKKEITRETLQSTLASGFDVKSVHSEYGMTELFSQAYSNGEGRFTPGPTMAVQIKDVSDPLADARIGKSGIINITDLANLDSCAFIETQDIGKLHSDGSFEVLGRLDSSDVRGCNLMVGDL